MRRTIGACLAVVLGFAGGMLPATIGPVVAHADPTILDTAVISGSTCEFVSTGDVSGACRFDPYSYTCGSIEVVSQCTAFATLTEPDGEQVQMVYGQDGAGEFTPVENAGGEQYVISGVAIDDGAGAQLAGQGALAGLNCQCVVTDVTLVWSGA